MSLPQPLSDNPHPPKSTVSEQQCNVNYGKTLRVFWITFGLNLLVSFSKLIAGFMTSTLSLTADGFHSLLDASANLVGIFSIKIASQPPDHDHPYGHGKFETMGAVIISFFLFVASFNVLQSVIERLTSAEGHSPESPWYSYAIVIASTLISLWVSRYEQRKGKELQSDLLLADSEHTLSDVYTSISVFVALICIHQGWTGLDIVVALGIVGIIFKAGFGIITSHLGTLVDEAPVSAVMLKAEVLTVEGVLGTHRIRSRGIRNNVFVDLHIQVDPMLTVREAHKIAHEVEDHLKALEGKFKISDVLVHIEEEHDDDDDISPHKHH